MKCAVYTENSAVCPIRLRYRRIPQWRTSAKSSAESDWSVRHPSRAMVGVRLDARPTVSDMTVAQLKMCILAAGLSYDGVIDKSDLRELARKALDALDDDTSDPVIHEGFCWTKCFRCGKSQTVFHAVPTSEDGRRSHSTASRCIRFLVGIWLECASLY